jgi:hypothetical protein
LHTMCAASKRVAIICHDSFIRGENLFYINEISSTISCHLVKKNVFSERIHPVPLQYLISNRILRFPFASATIANGYINILLGSSFTIYSPKRIMTAV